MLPFGLSVLLRGLALRKVLRALDIQGSGFCFSPLAGISFAERPPSETYTAAGFYRGFS